MTDELSQALHQFEEARSAQLQRKVDQLTNKLKDLQAQQLWQAKGGDPAAWQGLGQLILEKTSLDNNGALQGFDEALKAIPGIDRHFGQQHYPGRPYRPDASEDLNPWELVNQQRTAEMQAAQGQPLS